MGKVTAGNMLLLGDAPAGTMLLLAAQLSLSCAPLQFGIQKEPPIIMIRNRSNADIAAVTLREAGNGRQSSRFGSLSPVPKGVSQEVGRPTSPLQFPRTVAVEWTDLEGRTHVRELSLGTALKSATGERGEALVFEIGSVEDVLVFVERSISDR